MSMTTPSASLLRHSRAGRWSLGLLALLIAASSRVSAESGGVAPTSSNTSNESATSVRAYWVLFADRGPSGGALSDEETLAIADRISPEA